MLFGSSRNGPPQQPQQNQKAILSPDEFRTAMFALINPEPRKREGMIIPRTFGPVVIKTTEEKLIEGVFESCAFKCFMSCVLGN
jgi:hypothetical protein